MNDKQLYEEVVLQILSDLLRLRELGELPTYTEKVILDYLSYLS